jgi:type I restriction enzyme R subunit
VGFLLENRYSSTALQHRKILVPDTVSASSRPAAISTLFQGEGRGRLFDSEHIHWLEMIRDHVAANLGIGTDDFEDAPFAQEGGLGNAYRLFPDGLQTIIENLNVALAA